MEYLDPTQNFISLGDWLAGRDVVEWTRPLWEGGGWYLGTDGRLHKRERALVVDTPWVHHGHDEYNNCGLWSAIMFHSVAMRMKRFFADGRPFVPIGCQSCWKVVARPRTVVELFAMDELQALLDHPSKCGIERRETVPHLYGSYFYNRSFDAGLECFDKVRQIINDHPRLGPDIKVILKRGCTEMEHAVGPSDKWIYDEDQEVMERLLEDFIDFVPIRQPLPDPVVWHTKHQWIKFAFANGDESYLELTGGRRLTPDYVTYHLTRQRPAGVEGKELVTYHEH